MNVLQIILTICVIGMFIFSIGLINLVLKRFRNISKKKSIKPSLIDQMLFYERSPFAWRIGFAYSLLGYNQDQINEFNDAIEKIVLAEKNMYRLSRKDYMERFKKLIKTLNS